MWQQYLSFPPYPFFEDVKWEPRFVIILMACKKKCFYSIFASDIIPQQNVLDISEVIKDIIQLASIDIKYISKKIYED